MGRGTQVATETVWHGRAGAEEEEEVEEEEEAEEAEEAAAHNTPQFVGAKRAQKVALKLRFTLAHCTLHTAD